MSNSTDGGGGLLSNNQTTAAVSSLSGQSAGAFAASLVVSIVVFAVEILLFLLLKDRFARIYAPRTYLVPQKERTSAPDPGWFKWIRTTLKTSNSEFVQRSGLDAYFFLRYLRTLLKIFVPAACFILPILLPLNSVGGRGPAFAVGPYANQTNVTGLDQLAWGNVAPNHTGRYWAHWLLALGLIVWVCYIAFAELRGYIRMRQAYLTSPQHRLRASATTVLVSSIPQKWCSVEALDGLYDVFPGGLRNIWVNRNFDELQAKVDKRNNLALSLEAAETELIKKCWKEHAKKAAKAKKEAGVKVTKEEKKMTSAITNEKATHVAESDGVSSGDPHQVRHTVREAVDGPDQEELGSNEEDTGNERQARAAFSIPLVGGGIQTVAAEMGKLGKGVFGGLRNIDRGINNAIDTTNGFQASAPEEETNPVRRQSQIIRKPLPDSAPPAVTTPATQPEDYTGQPLANKPLPPPPSLIGEDSRECGRDDAQLEDGQQLLRSRAPTLSDHGSRTTSHVEKQRRGKFHTALKTAGLATDREPIEYPSAFNDKFESDAEDAVWRKYVEEKDRSTMRLPIFGWKWMISLPLLGQKVDTIYYCRKEVARLNVEIEDDQAHPDRFPLMNSAFVQFNHQVAAHMACQCVSHHIPKQMAPRLVEIDPNDVIWGNMSIPWWQNYIRTAAVISIVVTMIVLWAFPVAFTSALSQLSYLAQRYHWLHWLMKAPTVIINVIQGVLPAVFLAILMYLLPVILRLLVKLQGTQSGMLVELNVQKYYFFFLFVQLFLVVSIVSAAATILSYFHNIDSIKGLPRLFAQNIPKASNYFFSYMLLQALSTSAGALMQVGGLVSWFLLAPLLDTTARDKFKRQTQLSEIQWGTFFPVYTNLACIGLIYSVISPLILVFNIITFTLFWFVYRYNTLYVTKFTRDTGGLLYPVAINYTFTGIYVLEFCLAAMFFLVQDTTGDLACKGQAIGMIIILILTGIYQILLNQAFSPLFRYLPITLEDDAVRRDQEFARAMNQRHGIIEDEDEDTDLQDELQRRERQSLEEDRNAQEYEMQKIASDKERRERQEDSAELKPYQVQNPEITMNVDDDSRGLRLMKKTAQITADATINKIPSRIRAPVTSRPRDRRSWADRKPASPARTVPPHTNLSMGHAGSSDSFSTKSRHHHAHRTRPKSPTRRAIDKINNLNPLLGRPEDIEAQRAARNDLSNAIFAGVNDELEDLSPSDRDALVQHAFQHSALRARRPVVWIPRDELGVSDDAVKRMGAFSKNMWVSNVRQGLDSKGRCVYSGAPPDFSEVDVIQL